MTVRRIVCRISAYVWAAPNTALGLVAGLVLLCFGGRLTVVSGIAEFHGGLAGRFFAILPGPTHFGAMTLGHVILGVSQAGLSILREHEHVHVRQYERWGPFFLPAYGLSSAWHAAHGRRAYRDNCFEREAYALRGHQNPAD